MIVNFCSYCITSSLKNGVAMVMSVRMAPPLPLIFLLMIHNVFSENSLGVSYSHSHICALKNSSVIMSCSYTYPTGHQIKKVFWTKNPEHGKEPPDLSEDPEYSQRLRYLGDEPKNCTIRLSHVTQKDENEYCFRFITDKPGEKWLGHPGVHLTVTDLQVEAPERVTEGDSVRLTCKSSCALTDRATFIWYRNSQPLTERRDRNNQLLLQSVRREDAGRYSCALQEHTYISPAVQLSVTYPPKDSFVAVSPSGEIVEGDSVTLNCSSDSNPPAEISWFKGATFVGSGRIYSISKISSDHSGEYKCKSSNKHGEKYSDTVTLNVTYPPKNVSVFINGSGEIVEGDSVTLICSSDSNPPALNFSWFKEDQKSSVGSGQSFSALQSGRFYCEAHNQHGSQRSDAVTVTVHGRKLLYAAGGVTGGLGGLIFIFIIVWLMRKKQRPNHIAQKQDDLYVNVSAHNGSLSESDAANQNDALYSLITLSNFSHNQTEGKASDSEDTEEVQYVSVLYHRNNEMNQPEENESQYDNIRKYQTDAARRSTDQMVEDQSVIYSAVK
uniref:B-cell receptor CD22 n=1 Tax=Cyprinus carpio TaxID=7962 RepID=A0A8C1S319_CYPCA